MTAKRRKQGSREVGRYFWGWENRVRSDNGSRLPVSLVLFIGTRREGTEGASCMLMHTSFSFPAMAWVCTLHSEI